jgi:hypothetical protein
MLHAEVRILLIETPFFFFCAAVLTGSLAEHGVGWEKATMSYGLNSPRHTFNLTGAHALVRGAHFLASTPLTTPRRKREIFKIRLSIR